MPAPSARLTRDLVADHIHAAVFAPSPVADGVVAPAHTSVGVELEWLTNHRLDRRRLDRRDAQALIDDLAPLPGKSCLTIEPGGQLELSSPCSDDLDSALAVAALDLYVLDRACAARSIELLGLGVDPEREPERVLDAPRYEAMEAFFDHDGSAGRTMMCNTASLQVNIGLGPEALIAERWCLANALCPTLIAAFANSPFAAGGPSGWRSTRMRSWLTLDPSRAGAPSTQGDPIARFIDYALDARVMLIRIDEHDCHPIVAPLSFEQWLTEGHELGWPTTDDLAYHLTTLFPPVRPKGWLEIRVIDALPTPFWQVATAVSHAVLTEPSVTAEAHRAVAGTERSWRDAAQLGLGHPALRDAALRVLDLAITVLTERDDVVYAELVEAYLDRWVSRARTPGDDLLDEWRRTGQLHPPRQSPVLSARELLVELDHR